MTLEELDAIHRQASWLIAKRSGVTALKAITIGSESLDKTITKIADMYDLTTSERRTLRPSIADDVQTGSSMVADIVKSGAGIKAATDATKIVDTARKAAKAGRIGKTLVTVMTRGPKAAQTFANTGRLVGRANPLILGATIAWTVGSTGWFARHASKFNNAAYELQKAKLAPDSSQPA